MPESWKKLDGSVLKMIAVITMLIDHTAVAFLSKNRTVLFTIGSQSFTLYRVMRGIGRISSCSSSV